MSIYQELQLNQAGSKALIRNSRDKKEKYRHMAVYVLKVFLTLAFCILFISLFTGLFGAENSAAGVAVLLFVMVFRQADLGLRAGQSVFVMLGIFAVLAAGPHLACQLPPGGALAVNAVCIMALLFFGCHNLVMSNHATLVLSYILLYGNDVSGTSWLRRCLGLAAGGILTAGILYWKHRKYPYKRGIKDLFLEFRPDSLRNSWQIRLAMGVSAAMFLAELFSFPRVMWVGFAAMSVLQPFEEDLRYRSRYRVLGCLGGGVLFLLLQMLLPEEWLSMIGLLGGICVGFSAAYGWQTVFNSLGALAAAVGPYGVMGAVLLRYATNIFAVLFSLFYHKVFIGVSGMLINKNKLAGNV